ncbi:hypothetical protein Jden_1040 [Jonesia denitrificans DSM 20603]|uniref:DUF3046 domain-containing protein n=2 Tax=Jonesia TaxID=43673 RepID=C7R3G0_JONDD|nr:hypothetical protein Jden_1040 [Jonesia denitrificans DSM 20603]SQH20685.1 Protein of uncharacterised function (DUF3046) [Jonesia denitrificans]
MCGRGRGKMRIMRLRDFWLLVDEVFDPRYGRTLVSEHHLDALDNLTAAQALERGAEPRDVWHALCDSLDVPDRTRWGHDPFRQAPPRR